MAIFWPATLPAPQRSGLIIKPNPDVRVREAQSGRKELRRFGAGKPDTLTCTLRLFSQHPQHGDQVAAFKHFWRRGLNFGLNWIDADWLSLLGYTNHYCRIIGYSPRRSMGSLYTDYDVTFAIQQAASVWADTEWPSEGSGATPVEPSQEGLVLYASYIWSSFPPPGDVYAVKVTCVQRLSTDGLSIAVALNADGTVVAWGRSQANIDTTLPGLSSLGGIVDIEGDRGGLYYLTATGAIGHIGSPWGGSGYPASAGWYKFLRMPNALKAVVNTDGLVSYWGSGSVTGIPTPIYCAIDPWLAGRFTNGNAQGTGFTIFPDQNGAPYFLGLNFSSWPAGRPSSGVVCGAAGNTNTSSIYLNDGTWWDQAPSNTFTTGRPVGLVPKMITGGYGPLTNNGLAIHSDDTLVGWNLPSDLVSHLGQKVLQALLYCGGKSAGSASDRVTYVMAIKKV